MQDARLACFETRTAGKGGKVNASHRDLISIETRVVGGLVILVLLLAVIVLYFFPDYTDPNFSWTIVPRSTAIIIGAGYAAGAYFFVRVITEKRWHRVQAGFLSITAFTIFMLAATVLHWNRFHQGTFQFYLWTIIYLITPVLVPFLWWRNRAGAAGDLEQYDLRFSAPARWLLGVLAVGGVLFSVLVFVLPSVLIAVAPWKLTELTARVFAGWSMLTFLTVLTIATDGRWSATRILLQSAMIGQALALLALPRMWNDLDPSRPMTLVFVVGLALALMIFAGIHLWLDRLSRHRRSDDKLPAQGGIVV
jgi:hypothetical protein